MSDAIPDALHNSTNEGCEASAGESVTSTGSRSHSNAAMWPAQPPLKHGRTGSSFLRTGSSQPSTPRSGSAAEPLRAASSSHGEALSSLTAP